MRVEEGKFMLNRREAIALLAHAHEDAARPHIACVGFFPKSGCAKATDGHRFAELQSERGAHLSVELRDGMYDAPDFVVPRDVMQLAIQASQLPGSAEMDLHVFDDHIGVGSVGMHRYLATCPYEVPVTRGGPLSEPVRFPPHQHLPLRLDEAPADREVALAVSLDARYLATLPLVTAATNGGSAGTLHLPSSCMDPILFHAGDWRVLIMPARLQEAVEMQEKRDKANAARKP